MTSPAAPALTLDSSLFAGSLAAARAKTSSPAHLRAQAEDFEASFVNSMFQHMFTGIDGEGPFGNSPGVGPWRSLLTEQYAKAFVKAGGTGLADQVYRSLLAHQETRAK
jgi:flagellar protein FlgJ